MSIVWYNGYDFLTADHQDMNRPSKPRNYGQLGGPAKGHVSKAVTFTIPIFINLFLQFNYIATRRTKIISVGAIFPSKHSLPGSAFSRKDILRMKKPAGGSWARHT